MTHSLLAWLGLLTDGVNAAHNANLRAAYLLIFADTASSVCVVINAVLV